MAYYDGMMSETNLDNYCTINEGQPYSMLLTKTGQEMG